MGDHTKVKVNCDVLKEKITSLQADVKGTNGRKVALEEQIERARPPPERRSFSEVVSSSFQRASGSFSSQGSPDPSFAIAPVGQPVGGRGESCVNSCAASFGEIFGRRRQQASP